LFVFVVSGVGAFGPAYAHLFARSVDPERPVTGCARCAVLRLKYVKLTMDLGDL